MKCTVTQIKSKVKLIAVFLFQDKHDGALEIVETIR
jgi:hypothetical protein